MRRRSDVLYPTQCDAASRHAPRASPGHHRLAAERLPLGAAHAVGRPRRRARRSRTRVTSIPAMWRARHRWRRLLGWRQRRWSGTSARGQRQGGQRRRPSTTLGWLPLVETPLAERPRAPCCADGDVPGSVLPATGVHPRVVHRRALLSARQIAHSHTRARVALCKVHASSPSAHVALRAFLVASGARTHGYNGLIGAHSGPARSVGAPIRAGPVRRRFVSQDIPDDCVLTDRLGQQGLASGSVAFPRVQALGIRSSHPAKRAAPSRARAATMRAAQRRDRQAGIGVTQKVDALFCATPFVPVQSPSVKKIGRQINRRRNIGLTSPS